MRRALRFCLARTFFVEIIVSGLRRWARLTGGPDDHPSRTLQRHLSNLKLISRLLGHELHTQGSSKTITLSRDEVIEIQNTIDLFIEEATRSSGKSPSGGFGTAAGGDLHRNARSAGTLSVDAPVLPARN